MKKAVENEPGQRFRTLHALRFGWVYGAIAICAGLAAMSLAHAQGYNLGAFWRSQANNPIALVQSAGASADSPTVTMPGASKAGDLIVVTLWGEATSSSEYAGSSVTDSAGNTYALAGANSFDGYGYTALFYAKNIQAPTSTPLTFTVNMPNLQNGDDGDAAVSAAEFSGVDRNNPLDQVATNSGGASTPPATWTTGTTATTSKAYELLVATVSTDGDSTITMTPSGSPLFTTLINQSDVSVTSAGMLDYAISSSTGTFADTWAVSTGVGIPGYAGVIATFKGAQSSSNLPSATKFVLTSSAQSLVTHQCSAMVGISAENASGVPTAVASDQVVTLSGTGLQFYSDSACTVPISSVTFTSTSGTNQGFYFAATTPGTITLTATPTSLSAVTQNETITLATGTWLGNGGNSNWSNASNWVGGAVPNTYNPAIFDSNCISCNATIDSMSTAPVLEAFSSYTGVITNTAASETFFGFELNGGTFNAGSGTVTVESGFSYSSTATLNAQTGTFMLGDANSAYFTIVSSGGAPTFNNLTFNNQGTQNYAGFYINGNFNIAGNLLIDNAPTTPSRSLNLGAAYGSQSSNLYVAGNVTATSGDGGSATIILNGNNNTQTLSGVSAGILPNVTIAHTGTGGVTFSGTLVFDQNLTQVSGTVTPGTSTVQMGRNDSVWDTTSALTAATTLNFYNLVFNKAGYGQVTINGGTFDIANNFTVSDTTAYVSVVECSGSTPIFNLYGNLSLGTDGLGSYCPATLNFTGTGAQTVSSAGGQLQYTDVEVVKTGGSLSLGSNITIPSGDFTIQQGTLNLAGYVLNVGFTLELEPAGILNCGGGCGGLSGYPAPPATQPSGCGFGTGDLLCNYLDMAGGVINP